MTGDDRTDDGADGEEDEGERSGEEKDSETNKIKFITNKLTVQLKCNF